MLTIQESQHTTQGERLVQKELRKILLKYKLHTDQDLFDWGPRLHQRVLLSGYFISI